MGYGTKIQSNMLPNAMVFGWLVAVIGLIALPSSGLTIGFEAISTNSPAGDLLTLQGQLSVVVTDLGTDARFEFLNNVGLASSITDIYIQDPDSLFDWTSAVITSSGGVAFSEGANPPNLPSGALSPLSYSLDSDTPVTSNGVNAASEWLRVTVPWSVGAALSDLEAALNASDFLIGLHVQSIGTLGRSDAFVSVPPNNPPNDPPNDPPVPEPATMGLVGLGVGALVLRARKNRVL